MAFDNIVLNSSISVNGWHAGRMTDAVIGTTRSWQENRSSRSPYPRRKYEIPFDRLSPANKLYMYSFYEARNGPVRSFLLWDHDFFYLNGQALANGDGVTTAFQIGVTLGDSVNSVFKAILHPVPAGTTIPYELQGVNPGITSTTYTVLVNGVTQTYGSAYTVNTSTGIITFASAPPSGYAVTVSCWYYTTVRFDGAEFSMELQGILGNVQASLLEVFNE